MTLGPASMRMLGMAPALMGIADPGRAASVMMSYAHPVMHRRCIRLQERLVKIGVPETLLLAAVAHNFETNGRQSIHAERVLGAR